MGYFCNDTARDYAHYRNSKGKQKRIDTRKPMRRVQVICPQCRYIWMVETDIVNKKVYSVCGECGFKVEI